MNKVWNGEKIRVRPSSIDASMACGRQWYWTHPCGNQGIPGGRASIGTSVHEAADVLWKDAILSGSKDANLTKLNDAGTLKMRELDKEGVQYDDGENLSTAEKAILKGVKSLITDIVPFTDIPLYSEKRFTVKIDHPVISEISGTADYISHDTIADLKTSKRKPVPMSHLTQQSIYKYLAEENGVKVDYSVIQGIAFLKASTVGHILPLEPNIPLAKRRVNSLLDTLDVMYKDIIDPELLFRPNPKHYLCSNKYCAFYKECEAT